jgi:hypothetical protein
MKSTPKNLPGKILHTFDVSVKRINIFLKFLNNVPHSFIQSSPISQKVMMLRLSGKWEKFEKCCYLY